MSYPAYRPVEDDETPEQVQEREEYNRYIDDQIEEGKNFPGFHWTRWPVGWEPY